MSGDFSPDQKRYLEGFVSGLNAARATRGALPGGAAKGEPVGPDAIHLKAQDKVTAAGGKLADQEKFKREQHPFDAYDRLKEQARDNDAAEARGQFPLALLRPVLRRAGAELLHVPAAHPERHPEALAVRRRRRSRRALRRAVCACDHAREFADPRDRAEARGRGRRRHRGASACGRAAPAPTTSATSPARRPPASTAQELIDTRPYAREWHFHILNDRALYGLPRKFNVGFDGGGIIPVLEDTNDIGFQAVEVIDGHGIEPGVWFRLALGGITGHRDFARDTGVLVKPKDATKVADAIVRVYIENGDRTNRNKARLKYVLDAWGFEKFLAAVEEKLGWKLQRAPAEAVKPRPAFDRSAHIGVHAQKQAGLNWIGVVFPVGKITVAQMRGLAKIAHDLGDGDIRLTVWQNLLISGVPDDKVALAEAAHRGARAHHQGDRRSAPGSSPAPARPAAASPPRTPRRMPRRSPRGASRASRSTRRSTSISPAAITPARSTTSATSA